MVIRRSHGRAPSSSWRLDQMESHFFLATVRPDGRPHLAGSAPLWVDGKFYFVSGPGTRKSQEPRRKG